MVPNVEAIIVTYNRKLLLARCIDAVLAQSVSVNRITVIDNASTDGTEDYICSIGLMSSGRVTFVRMNENTGGAGGFAEGIRRAYRGNASHFWIMDDDGYPAVDCLEKLVDAFGCEAIHYAAPNLIADDGISHFETKIANSKTRFINFRGGPFNGILMSRTLVAAVGYPMNIYFIWGDEYEYTNRIQDAGFLMVMVSDAIYRHKSTKYSFYRCPRPYYLSRNMIYTARLSKGMYVSKNILRLQTMHVIAKLILCGFAVLNFKQVHGVIRGVYDGLTEQLELSKADCAWDGVENSDVILGHMDSSDW